MVNPKSLWFNTIIPATLCRAGGNGPNHPSQLYAIKRYMQPYWSFLDYGCGSATTYEAWMHGMPWPAFRYRGLDIIPKNIAYCKEKFPKAEWKVNKTIHKIDEPDNSWDVVYSRHVVDHMNSFEEAMDEHLRVAKQRVIVILWVALSDSDDHEIKNITDNGKIYKHEYTNRYSRKKVEEYLREKQDRGWYILELTEGVGSEVRGHDTVIVLGRRG